MSYLLDTNHCSQIILQNADLLYQLAQHSEAKLFTSAIVQGELIDMVGRSQQKASNLLLVKKFLSNIEVLAIVSEIADIYGNLKSSIFEHFAPKEKEKGRRFKLQNLGFSDNDLWIAATAINYDLILVSRDNDFIRLQEITPFSLESWIS